MEALMPFMVGSPVLLVTLYLSHGTRSAEKSPALWDRSVPRAGRASLREQEDIVRVLLIEDDQAVAEMYKIKLELDGYAVEIVSDGENALRLATDNPPDIVFLDIRLPNMDGLTVLEQLRRDDRTRSLPVVILSNFSQAELVQRGLTLGALEYLIKSQTTPAQVAGNVPNWLNS
jgi:CheY-like chemotaxis protein